MDQHGVSKFYSDLGTNTPRSSNHASKPYRYVQLRFLYYNIGCSRWEHLGRERKNELMMRVLLIGEEELIVSTSTLLSVIVVVAIVQCDQMLKLKIAEKIKSSPKSSFYFKAEGSK